MTSFSGNQQTYEYHTVDNFEVDNFGVRLENRSSGCWSSSSVKLVQLCCIGILLPIVWIIIPVYARFFLYANSAVPLAFTQMRVLDSNFNTFWCQGHYLYTNISLIDSYLMDRNPIASYQTQKMTHHFELDDDLKEFWGFYLLKGSKLTIRSCARYMGATVMLVKGNSSLNLLSCLKDGLSSSEEMSTEAKENITLQATEILSSHPSSERNAQDTQFATNNNVTINDRSTTLSKLDEEVEEIENGAFEVNDENIIKEKDIFTNPLISDVSESDESLTSSSEEALLACASPVMNQFVVPAEDCNSTRTKYSLLEYTVENDGYYSIIFSSNFEQKGQVKNPVFTEFDLVQNIYNTTNAIASCHNATECRFSLSFASTQQVVVALSAPHYDAEDPKCLDTTFSVESQCIPRTSVYLTFGLTLPLVLILCAFL
ncbi:hypothetical protein DAPPUDRAFT_299889 [Daphnia pulex]|uniref:E3 ubiquitin-protein ligase APD1-4 middle domain-containing protein n=1 Tax=Daphnia pulex TaxID=6669 RepID=E9FQU7_DAPPU|nr:hypothetical protein DAPPUDRAFT_299889 [Daphnia pulex]|eukprot:EFX90050.1 hypothetical protein DAPPUDRAFT_299889 [Daphnia pulex]